MAQQEWQLEEEEIAILELYSQGVSYDKIKNTMFTKFFIDYKERGLGHKMGDLKNKMGCTTQFGMGYKYAQSKIDLRLEAARENMQNDLDILSARRFKEGKALGMEIVGNQSLANARLKGWAIGVVMASLALGSVYLSLN